MVEWKNKGVGERIERSKGESFVGVEIGENLWIRYEWVRFLG